MPNIERALPPETNLEYLFQTPIWHLRNRPLPKGIYEWCLEYRENNSTIKEEKSNRGGYQSPGREMDPRHPNHEPFPYLEYVKSQLHFLPSFVFSNWWININEKGDYNTCHTHPKSDLSVVWYITDNHRKLTFIDPNGHCRTGLTDMFPELWLAENWDCAAGDFVIFPAFIPHHVEPHTENSPRISIAFNLRSDC